MATKFGRLDHEGYSFEEQIFHKNQEVTSASIGVSYFLAKRDDYVHGDHDAGVLTTSGTHWAFIHTMFYMSGSQKVLEEQPADSAKFDNIFNDFNQFNDLKPFHITKFHSTASIFSIPQALFGERIKPGSFQLTARTGSSSDKTNEIIIKDDNNGNLYAPYTTVSSSNTPLNSKDNYVGNIFYDLGLAILTETGSYSGSISDGTDIGSDLIYNAKTWTGAAGATPPNNWSVGVAGTFDRPLIGGKRVLDIEHNTTNHNPAVYQSFSTTAGKTYKIEYEYRNVDADNGIRVLVGTSIGGSENYNSGYLTYSGGTWPMNTHTFVATVETTYVTLEANTSTGGTSGYFDSVLIQEFEPHVVRYTDIGVERYPFWDIKFNSVTPIFTSQYTLKINSGDFNSPTNYTTKPALSGSLPSGSSQETYANLRHELTSGSFSPYFNQIHLYRNQLEEPIMIANLPKSIKMRDDIDLIITFRVDH